MVHKNRPQIQFWCWQRAWKNGTRELPDKLSTQPI